MTAQGRDVITVCAIAGFVAGVLAVVGQVAYSLTHHHRKA